MSTKNIRKALQVMADHRDQSLGGLAYAALAEVEAIEKACVMLYRQGVVQNELGEEHESTKALDDAADHLMRIGEESAS